MDQSRYDFAKDILLELLGWGVDPEYLVDVGLSRELVYYAFTELNLRLPSNLDTTGLLPYNPETVKGFSFIEPDPSSSGSPKAASPSRSHTDDTGESSDQAVAAPGQGDLHKIEMLRRQELIARKAAVQASRKVKKTQTAPVVAKVPSETVEDFLNSIMPAAEAVPTPSHTPTPPLVESPTERLTPSASPSPPPLATRQPDTAPLDAPPSSTESVTVAFDNAMRLSPDTISGDTTPTHQYPNRRGTKRPVASDFVDWDGSSRSLGRNNSNDVNPHHHHHHTRRKTGATSFVNVPMRCVIDLSDSETDEEDGADALTTTSKGNVPLQSNGVPVPYRSRLMSKSTSSTSTGTTTPSTLEETEREIERMKQLIAERTRRQGLKKLAVGDIWLESKCD